MIRLVKIFTFFLFVILVLPSDNANAKSSSKNIPSLDGFWKTDGYGYIFQIRNNEVNIFELTEISCLKSALRAENLSYTTGLDQRFGAKFAVSVPNFIYASMEISSGKNKDEILLHRTDTNTFMVAKKIEELPLQCSKKLPSTFQNNVTVFYQTFKEHYPFFKVRNTTWGDDLVSKLMSHQNELTDESLYSVLVSLVLPLKDSHTAIVAPSVDKSFFGAESKSPAYSKEIKDKAKTIIEDKYLTQPIKSYANDQLGFSILQNQIGYLQINGFYDYGSSEKKESDLIILNNALNNISKSFMHINGLIIDIRNNDGGSDFLAIETAKRFTNKKYLAYYKQAVFKNSDDVIWTPQTPTWVEPSDKPAFSGNIVLLTGSETISAAETFTMALMQRTPSVIRVGMNTRGSFSDMLPRILPNGWLFALPNERYLDERGSSFDFVGIPPDVVKPVFTQQDLENNVDSALESAMEILKK